MFHSFNVLSKIFSQSNVFLEIAVPTLLTGLDEFNLNETLLNGRYYWGGHLFDLERDYAHVKHFGHPFKLLVSL